MRRHEVLTFLSKSIGGYSSYCCTVNENLTVLLLLPASAFLFICSLVARPLLFESLEQTIAQTMHKNQNDRLGLVRQPRPQGYPRSHMTGSRITWTNKNK